MRAEKANISQEYLTRLNASPFFIVVDYQGLKVGPMTELRKRLFGAGAEVHVVKNSIFRIAAKESGVEDLKGVMTGQLAVVTGQKDICAAAKVVKTFASEFEKPKIKFGYMDDKKIDAVEIEALADLPPMDVLRAKLLGVIKAPSQKLAALINTPAVQLARVLKARVDKGE
jgi:large subunit ribosomal protein L10